jgi:hypothetical protein
MFADIADYQPVEFFTVGTRRGHRRIIQRRFHGSTTQDRTIARNVNDRSSGHHCETGADASVTFTRLCDEVELAPHFANDIANLVADVNQSSGHLFGRRAKKCKLPTP